MLVRSVGQSIVAMSAPAPPTFAGAPGGDSVPDSLHAWAGGSPAAPTPASGHQTRTPISCNMARWRWSRSRLMAAFSQTQAHHHRIFTLTWADGIIIFAQAGAAVTLAFVNLERPQIARAHLQPKPVGALTFVPQRQCIEHDAGPALALVLGCHREIEQVRLSHAFHGHKITKQDLLGQQQLGLVARL